MAQNCVLTVPIVAMLMAQNSAHSAVLMALLTVPTVAVLMAHNCAHSANQCRPGSQKPVWQPELLLNQIVVSLPTCRLGNNF